MAKHRTPPADDFDGIKLDNYVEPTGPIELHVCWSCLKQFPADRLVSLGGDCVLPVFSEENESRQKARQLVSFVIHMLEIAKKEHEDDKRDGGGDQFSWLTGRRN